MNGKTEVADVIREFRETRNLTQKSLAEALGVSLSTVSWLENKIESSGNIVTHGVYDGFIKLGVDLKEKISDLLIETRRGKRRVFNGNRDIPIKPVDPHAMYEDAVNRIIVGNSALAESIEAIDKEITEIKERLRLAEEKRDAILKAKKEAIDKILEVASK